MKIVTVVGARPQFIKLAPVSAALRHGHHEVLIHTGQHYDASMSGQFFDELGLPAIDHNLGVGSGGHGVQTGAMLAALEPVLLDERPDCVIVYGDTNSTLAGALAAAKLDIPVAHVEAGLRSGNRAMPEELNRVVTDHLSTLLFTPTATASTNLAAEGIRDGVHEVGDVMADALRLAAPRAPERSALLEALELPNEAYLLATVHRAATTDDPVQLAAVVDLLSSLPHPVVFPVHPRTEAALKRSQLMAKLTASGRITLRPPLSYLTMVGLLRDAVAVITDSGGLQKEAYLLHTPCVTLRRETEWVETVNTGWNTLVGLDAGLARAALTRTPGAHPPLYGDGHAANRVATILDGFLRPG